MASFDMPSTLRRDGLLVDDDTVVIRQRMGKGDITLRPADITGVRPSRSGSDMPFTEGSVDIRVGTKKYVLRRFPKSQRDAAVRALTEVMTSG